MKVGKQDMERLRKDYQNGMILKDIAAKYKYNIATVSKIINRK